MENIYFIILILYFQVEIYCINNPKRYSNLQINKNNRHINQLSSFIELQTISLAVDPYYIADGISCTTTNCPTDKGKCKTTSSCECEKGFANILVNSKPQLENGSYCSYQQKMQVTAFLLEFFIPFGVGHLYAERWVEGSIKLVLITLTCVFLLVLKIINKGVFIENQTTLSFVMLTFTTIMCCAYGLWQLLDLCLFGLNKFLDGKQMPLASW